MTLNFPPNNDEAQVRSFFVKLRIKILPRALSLTKYDHQLADMIVSDVLYKVHTDFEEWKKKDYFFASLNKALRNRFIDYRRRETKARSTTSLDVLSQQDIENRFSTDDEQMRELKEMMKEIQLFVDTLNPTLQDAFSMFFLQGLSHEEIAAEKRISKEHSRQNVSRLVKKLRQEFN